MDRKLISDICRQVYQKHPEVKGSQPEVKPQGQARTLFIFKSKGVTEDGHAINHILRVVVDDAGKIVKTTVSR